MTKRAINDVQAFLTFTEQGGNRIYQIVNVELLLRRHPLKQLCLSSRNSTRITERRYPS